MTEEAAASARAALGRGIGLFLGTLRETQFLAPEPMRDYQHRLLERLVRHARARVPFYRDSGRLDPLFRSDDSIDWRLWHEIPVMTRGDVQRAGAALHADALPPEHGATWTLSTSGSTGEPVEVVHTHLSRSLAWIAVLLRDYERYGIDPTRRLAHLAPGDPAKSDPTAVQRRNSWYPELAWMGLCGERYDIADTRDVRDIIDIVVSLRPDYLRIQPIVLDLMCANDDRRRLSDLGVRAITTVGEHISKGARATAEAHFRCRILDHYGSGECGRMASTCPHCNRHHVHADVVFLEVIDDTGEPTPPGAVGRIIVTPFYNYAMPLIRYDHADQAQVGLPGGCPITLPALDAVYGKERTAFLFSGGVVIRPTLPHGPIVRLLGAQSYQVAQVAPDRCEFRFVPGSLPAEDMQFDEMTALMRRLWWDGLNVDYRMVESLPRERYGKLKLFVREMTGGGAATADQPS